MKRNWLLFAILTTVFWGIWGAFSAYPETKGFPGTLIYIIWAITMIFPAIIALKRINWKLQWNGKAVGLGLIIGFTGAGGQLALLTRALKEGPAHLIFPVISLSPLLTIILSLILLKEKTNWKGKWGIVMALIAIPLLSMTPASGEHSGYAWLVYALVVFVAWGLQAYFMKYANNMMNAESIFVYMALTGLLLIPIAIRMTVFNQSINWGWSGPGFSFVVQLLNSIGALFLVYAFRYGKAIIVSPLTNALAPVLTIVLSLTVYHTIPNSMTVAGIGLAIVSAFLFSIE